MMDPPEVEKDHNVNETIKWFEEYFNDPFVNKKMDPPKICQYSIRKGMKVTFGTRDRTKYVVVLSTGQLSKVYFHKLYWKSYAFDKWLALWNYLWYCLVITHVVRTIIWKNYGLFHARWQLLKAISKPFLLQTPFEGKFVKHCWKTLKQEKRSLIKNWLKWLGIKVLIELISKFQVLHNTLNSENVIKFYKKCQVYFCTVLSPSVM